MHMELAIKAISFSRSSTGPSPLTDLRRHAVAFFLCVSEPSVGLYKSLFRITKNLVRMLLRKGVLKNEDVATLSGEATMVLAEMPGLSADVQAIATSCLRGFAQSWTKAVTTN